jgi:hypothetical protein
MCFITGKYSREVKNGGMIAYVMDGNSEKAVLSIGTLIRNKTSLLQMDINTGLELSSVLRDIKNIRETRHNLATKRFVIHHIFLAV